MYIQTSDDILNVSIAFAVVLVALFLSWLLYSMIAILRDTRAIVSDVRHKLETIENAVEFIRGKVETGFSSFGIVAAGLKQVISYVLEKRGEKMDDRGEEETPKSRRRR